MKKAITFNFSQSKTSQLNFPAFTVYIFPATEFFKINKITTHLQFEKKKATVNRLIRNRYLKTKIEIEIEAYSYSQHSFFLKLFWRQVKLIRAHNLIIKN